MKIMTSYEQSKAVQIPTHVEKTRLTRRGKAAVALGGLGLSLAAAKGIGVMNHEQPLKTPAVEEAHRSVVLPEGGTLWQLAHAAYPKRDPREVIPMLESQIPEEFHGVAQMNEQFILPADAQTGELVPAVEQTPAVNK